MQQQTTTDRQIEQAEEILGERLQKASFAKALFSGRFLAEQLPPYPLEVDEQTRGRVEQLREFCRTSIDPVAIDRQASIPQSVVQGLGRLGVLGACLPASCGGLGLSQTSYCRLLEVLGGHCASTALFVNAHHSIGPRAIVLFGTPQQQQRWLPRLATGEWISAFALTEPQAGSDAANVQTRATPALDGSGFVLNGEKRWITNGSIAQVLTVMARTGEQDGKSGITAFLVTPDMPGFQVVEPRMEKCGVRGTVTSRLRFENMFVPRDHVLGTMGKGLRIALTVLDYGRTTFGASCTGAAKTCLALAKEHVRQRIQFGRPLAGFELVQDKIARMHAAIFAMEACTYQTAALIDAGLSDFMVETAMLKVFTTEQLWQIIYDTFQLHGGLAYFTDQPFERMMRDARINSIGEGANDVLRVFAALVGMREVGEELQRLLDAVRRPIGHLSELGTFAGRRLARWLVGPEMPDYPAGLEPWPARVAANVAALAAMVEKLLVEHQQQIVERQCQVARLSDAATELYVSACVLQRLKAMLRRDHDQAASDPEFHAGLLYLRLADRRIAQNLHAVRDNDDAPILEHARRLLQ
ncbi:MAG: acyl-CoA dehydrogenase [Pirellulaceae bacterium]|nr:MAG: acyl-CoA dehydrogenase [Pirellulaceae bacterium]GIW93710.1 MAG: acyl-CoA dehydrogenase [Pirellulaceae bacterium]